MGAGRYRALVSIRLRQRPDINAELTGETLREGEPFEATEVIPTANYAYLKVGTRGWAFHVGVSGKWRGQPIVERLEVSSDEEAAERERERRAEAADAAAEASYDPEAAGEMELVKFLTWCKTQRSMKVHPGVTVRGGRLITSLPVEKGTPLIGVMSDQVLLEDSAAQPPAAEEEAYAKLLEAASASGLPAAHLRLALRLLAEKKDWKGSPWQTYLESLPRRAAGPSLWGPFQVVELQYDRLRESVKEERSRRAAFFDAQIKGNTKVLGGHVELDEFLTVLAHVEGRAAEVQPGRPAIVPLVDLVGPPEELTAGDAPEATCSLVLEDGGEGAAAIPVLYAAADLRPGDWLTRDLREGASLEDFFLRHGCGTTGGAAECVDVRVTLEDGAASEWQLEAIRRVTKLGLGKLQGDHVFPGQVRRCDDVAGALSPSMLTVARILTCRTEEEMEVFVGDVYQTAPATAGDSLGLNGLAGAKRELCVERLMQMVRSCRGAFATTVDEDVKALPSLKGNKRAAVAVRIEKKLVLEETLSLLERSRAAPEESGALPFAVTGARLNIFGDSDEKE